MMNKGKQFPKERIPIKGNLFNEGAGNNIDIALYSFHAKHNITCHFAREQDCYLLDQAKQCANSIKNDFYNQQLAQAV